MTAYLCARPFPSHNLAQGQKSAGPLHLAFDEGDDVALAVLAPGVLEAGKFGEAVDGHKAGQSVDENHGSPALQLLHVDNKNQTDKTENEKLGGPGNLRGVQKYPG